MDDFLLQDFRLVSAITMLILAEITNRAGDNLRKGVDYLEYERIESAYDDIASAFGFTRDELAEKISDVTRRIDEDNAIIERYKNG